MRILSITIFLIQNLYGYSQNWNSLGGGINDAARQMYTDSANHYLYVSGRFSEVDGKRIKGIARWNGYEWDSLSAGLDGLDTLNQFPNGLAFGMAEYNSALYVCGNFTSLGNVKAKHIGKWNGVSWDSLAVQPNIPHGSPSTIAIINNELYLGGAFDTVAEISANSIAKWDGVNWSQLSFPNLFPLPAHNIYSSVASICLYHGNIYAAGGIKSYPVDTIGGIMAYDGIQWKTVSGGIKGINAGIGSMVVYHNELYVAGNFISADGNPGNNIQKWNDTIWSDVGGGTGYSNGSIYRLLIYHDELYAMGVFQEAGNIPADRIAKWDGTKWCSLGSVFDNVLTACSVYNDSLYIGGGFSTIDGDSINYVAKWTGGNYIDSCQPNVGFEDLITNQFVIYPNPASDKLKFENNSIRIGKIKIIDVLFKEIYLNEKAEINNLFDISFLTSGIYFLILETKEGHVVKKFVKE